MIAVRKVYQKAIVTPTHHIEQLWKDYENYENSVSRQLVILSSHRACILSNGSMDMNMFVVLAFQFLDKKVYDIDSCMQAKGLISEYQPKFNSARAVYRERKKYADEIDLNVLAVPPTGSSKALFYFLIWHRWFIQQLLLFQVDSNNCI